MRKVKGMLLVPWVKVVRSDKTGMFDKWLDDSDRKIISARVLPSSWYPFETYRHIFDAVSTIFARGDEKIIHDWGQQVATEMLTGTYRIIIVPNSPMESMKKCMFMGSIFFDPGETEMKVTGEKSFEIHCIDYPADFKNLYLLLRGWYTRLLILAGAQNIENEITAKSWLGNAKHSVISFGFD